MGKGAVLSFYCLAYIYLLISVFLHPMKIYPLPYRLAFVLDIAHPQMVEEFLG